MNDLNFFLGFITCFLIELPAELCRIYYRKKCNYNCDKCKVFDCPYLHCQYLKNKKKN